MRAGEPRGNGKGIEEQFATKYLPFFLIPRERVSGALGKVASLRQTPRSSCTPKELMAILCIFLAFLLFCLFSNNNQKVFVYLFQLFLGNHEHSAAKQAYLLLVWKTHELGQKAEDFPVQVNNIYF